MSPCQHLGSIKLPGWTKEKQFLSKLKVSSLETLNEPTNFTRDLRSNYSGEDSPGIVEEVHPVLQGGDPPKVALDGPGVGDQDLLRAEEGEHGCQNHSHHCQAH